MRDVTILHNTIKKTIKTNYLVTILYCSDIFSSENNSIISSEFDSISFSTSFYVFGPIHMRFLFFSISTVAAVSVATQQLNLSSIQEPASLHHVNNIPHNHKQPPPCPLYLTVTLILPSSVFNHHFHFLHLQPKPNQSIRCCASKLQFMPALLRGPDEL